jgi:hypothetical protein
MSAQNDPTQRVAIGLSFGNSYSSIAYTTGVSGPDIRAFRRGILTDARKERSRLSPTKTEVRRMPLFSLHARNTDAAQIARSRRRCHTSRVRSSTVDRQRASSSAMRRTPSPTSATCSDKSRLSHPASRSHLTPTVSNRLTPRPATSRPTQHSTPMALLSASATPRRTRKTPSPSENSQRAISSGYAPRPRTTSERTSTPWSSPCPQTSRMRRRRH